MGTDRLRAALGGDGQLPLQPGHTEKERAHSLTLPRSEAYGHVVSLNICRTETGVVTAVRGIIPLWEDYCTVMERPGLRARRRGLKVIFFPGKIKATASGQREHSETWCQNG